MRPVGAHVAAVEEGPQAGVDGLALVHGELDTVVPLTGGNSLGIVFPSTQLSVETFALANKGDIKLVTDTKWSHDWQPEWSELFTRFLASK